MTGISTDGGEWQPPAPASMEAPSSVHDGYPPAPEVPAEDRSWFRPAAKRRALATSALAAALLFVGGGFAGYELNGASGSSISVQGGPGGAGGFSAEGGAGQGAPGGGVQGGPGSDGGVDQNGTPPSAAAG